MAKDQKEAGARQDKHDFSPAEEAPRGSGWRAALPAGLGMLGAILVLVGFALWFIQRRWAAPIWVPLGAGAALLVVCGVLYRITLVELVRSRAFASALSTTVAAVAIIGLLVVGNYIAYRRVKGPMTRWDFTKARLYSFSDQTNKVLKGLNKDVTIVGFYPPDGMMPVELNKARQVLEEFKARSGRIKADIIDPDLHPEKAKEYDVSFYPVVIVQSGDKKETLSSMSEENVINAILKVTRETNPKVYFLSGHGEQDPDAPSGQGMNLARRVLEKKLYDVEKLTLIGKNEVPADCDVLILAGPKATLQPTEIQAIKKYLDGGGSLLAMLDPPPAADLNPLLRSYGLETPGDLVYDRAANANGSPIYPAVLEYTSHEITRNLPYTLYIEARPVVKAGTPPANVTITELAKTTSDSYAEPKAGSTVQEAAREQQAAQKGVTTPAAQRRQGPLSLVTIAWDSSGDTPAAEEEKEEATAQPKKPKRGLRLAVCGDSDFATDQLLGLYGNAALFLNLVNWLAHEEDLIAVPPKSEEGAKVVLTSRQAGLLVLVSLILMPLAIIVSGVTVWFLRR